jgi:hypothetical protein
MNDMSHMYIRLNKTHVIIDLIVINYNVCFLKSYLHMKSAITGFTTKPI